MRIENITCSLIPMCIEKAKDHIALVTAPVTVTCLGTVSHDCTYIFRGQLGILPIPCSVKL